MSKEKQIEEMILIVKKAVADNAVIVSEDDLVTLDGNDFDHAAAETAEVLYNAGYRKQGEGEWIEDKAIGTMNQKLNCSVCNWKTVFCVMGKREYKFCPNCGARMKGGAE